MEPIQSFAQLTAHLKKLNHRKRIAVVCANDPNTEYAITRALEEGIAEFLMIGDSAILEKYPTLKQYPEYIKIIHIEDSDEAAREAVRIVREGGADILMKGIINTDNLLHAILDKEKGLLPKGKILTHLAVMEIPTYHKLLFFSDAAVIPRPTLQQRIEMIWYAICTCRHFGIEQPRIALIHCTEKVSAKFPHSLDYVNIVELAEAGEFGNVIIDGPLDVRTACDTLQPDEIWLKKGSNSWYTLCQCPSCTGSGNAAGQGVFQRYKLSRRDGLHWSFARCAQMPDAESLARWEKLRTAQLERMRAKAEKQAAEK